MKTALILGTVAVAFVFAEPEAEPKADAEADPYLLYGGYTGLHYPYASSYYSYPAYTYGYGSYLTYGRKKREAEAEPKADADPYYLYGLVGKNVHGYVHPTHGYATGIGAYPAYTLGSYLTYGRKKREADSEPKAEADPYLLYGGYGGYAGLHYPGYYSYPAYTTYPAYTLGSYVTYGRKKREAESDPKAEADPALLYASAYAYPRYSYGYSYPTYSYGYPYYRYGYY